MQKIIQDYCRKNHIDDMRVVDITTLKLRENRGYPYAVLLLKYLPKEYIGRLNNEGETDYSVFSVYEQKTDELADELVAVIQKEGYRAISQSENGIDSRDEYDGHTKSTVLPTKKIAVMAGLGWIGKNNLLITEECGAALSMCSVLTDMPLGNIFHSTVRTEPILSSRCGECDLCIKRCPTQAIYGRKWELGMSRDDMIDVNQCIACLKCLAGCRYSVRYSKL